MTVQEGGAAGQAVTVECAPEQREDGGIAPRRFDEHHLVTELA
jgi:hypothetical protein